jgi:hypothetical protein
MVGRFLGKKTAKDIERIGSHAAQAVICGTHYKLDSRSYCAEFAYYQPVAKFRIVEKHVLFFKLFRMIIVVIMV